MSAVQPFTELEEKFINMIMRQGKKTVARRVFTDTMKYIRDKGMKNTSEVFEKSLENIAPHLEVRAKRVGGAVYQIPFEVPEKRRRSLAIRWILNISKARKGKPMAEALGEEMINAFNNTGDAIKKKEETHKMADANKAFAHFARY